MATDSVSRRATNADGSNLARRLAKDAALRRTLADLRAPHRTAGAAASLVVGGSVADIPAVAVTAYQRAAFVAGASNPGCDVPWTLVAGIGRVESDHGRYGGSTLGADGVVRPAILGPVLDGTGGNAAISDTDAGRYDANTRWDRAVGPMQFIPSTWSIDGRDGNGDGVLDPENLFDAALGAADYLCASGGNLTATANAERAVLSYNHSLEYVLVVMGYSASYGGQDVTAVTADIAKYLAALARVKNKHKKAATRPAKKPAKKAHKPPVRRRPKPAPRRSRQPSPRPPAPTTLPTPAPTQTPTPSPALSATPTPSGPSSSGGTPSSPSPSVGVALALVTPAPSASAMS